MGWFCDALESLWDFVKALAEAIWNVVKWIVENLLPAVLIAIGGVVGVVAIVSIFAPAVASALVTSLVSIGTGIFNLTVKIVTGTFEFAVAAIETLGTGFATLLEAINFSAILEVHQILWILSADYRELIGQLFDAISEVSEALFGHTMVLHLIFRNTRNLVLTTSSMLGRPYDIAQITWLSTFDDILIKFNEKAEVYMEDPEQLFIDLEEWSEKHAIDIGGDFRASELSAMRASIEGIKRIALDLKGLNDDYNAFRFALPSERLQIIKKYTDPISLAIGDFRFSTYERHRLETSGMVRDNREAQERNRTRIRDIDWTIKRPSRSIGQIDKLPPDEREAEEIAIDEYTSRELGRDTEELVRQQDERIAKEEEEKVIEEIVLPAPDWEAIKEKETYVPTMKRSKRRDSPFVGDY